MFQPVHVLQNNQNGGQPVVSPGFPFQGKSSYPYNVQSPMVGLTPSPMTHPLQQMPNAHPPIPMPLGPIRHPSNASSHSADGQETPPIAPYQSVPVMPPMVAMNGGFPGMTPPLIPILQVQTPNGLQYQPLYYYSPDQAPLPGIPIPEQHPVQQMEVKKLTSRSRSFDGSEISDSGDAMVKCGRSNSYSVSAVSLNRYSSDVSSRDGHDHGSETYESDLDEEESPKAKVEVESPDTLINAFQKMSTSTYQAKSDSAAQSATDSNSENTDSHKPHQYVDKVHSKSSSSSQFHSGGRPRRNSRGEKRPTSKERQEELYKTELCNMWINGTKCRFGKRCIFAHGQHELRLPKRKLERKRLRAPLRKQVVSLLGKMSEVNFDSLCTELLCAIVEDVRDNEHDVGMVAKAVFHKATSEPDLGHLYAEVWRKLLNVHPLSQMFAKQMTELCLQEYNKAQSKAMGFGTMRWVAVLCKQKVMDGEATARKILADMSSGSRQPEQKVEMWCKLIECLKNTIDNRKYFSQLAGWKSKVSARVRHDIMNLEDLKKRNWVRRA